MEFKNFLKYYILILPVFFNAQISFASTPDAWNELRNDVKKACLKATEGTFKKPKIFVDPFGSDSYGLAVIQGESKYDKSMLSIICIYNKTSKKVEIGSELTDKNLMKLK